MAKGDGYGGYAQVVPIPESSTDIENYLGPIVSDIEDAIDFFQSDYAEELERGLRYYNGEVDIPEIEGRSHAVSTQVRDAIRNLKPSILRVLCSDRKMVKYIPSSVQIAPVVEQQAAYIHSLFWRLGGYRFLHDSVDETLKMRMVPMKAYWVEDNLDDYNRITMLTAEEVQEIGMMEGTEVISVENNPNSPLGGIEVFDIEVVQENVEGRIVLEAIPATSFFISRNATTTKDARVHGQQQTATVAEAIEMGIDFDDWFSLDNADNDLSANSDITEQRRGARKEQQEDRGDVLSHEFTLTEAYIKIDLEDAGVPQLYCVYFGGSNYVYLGHQRESESPFEVASHDPRAFAAYGQNIADITMPQQDVLTSLLRSTIDNAHAANHPRIGANPAQVRFDDLMNHDIGHPFRMKPGAQVQVVAIPSTLQGSLPLLQWLESDSQNKLGITKAAQGLDPDAMQSTDKDAVKNTIMLSQGQVELMVRNIIETGLIPIFRKLMRLSIQHLPRRQIVSMKGTVIPVDQMLFDPDLYAEPLVGLGAKDANMRVQGLQLTLQQQMNLIQQLGMDNPFVSAHHVYNTLEDLTEQFGLTNVSRYYNLVTPQVEKAYADKKAKEAQAAAAAERGKDPAEVLLQTEQIKAGTEKLKIAAQQRSDGVKATLKALELDAKDDLERDKLTQSRVIDLATLAANTGVKIDDNSIKREQAEKRDSPTGGMAGKGETNGGDGGGSSTGGTSGSSTAK